MVFNLAIQRSQVPGLLLGFVLSACGQPQGAPPAAAPVSPPTSVSSSTPTPANPGYPYPAPNATRMPTPALTEPLAGLPPGSLPNLTQAHSLGFYDYDRYDLVPLDGPAGADLAVVRSRAGRSEVALLLSSAVSDDIIRWKLPSSMSRAAEEALVMVETPGGWWLVGLVLPNRDRLPEEEVTVQAALPLADADIGDGSEVLKLDWLYWTGDDFEDPVVTLSVPGGGGSDQTRGVLFVAGEGPEATYAATLAEDDTVIDLDDDGIGELVITNDAGGWDVHRWDGSAFLAAAGPDGTAERLPGSATAVPVMTTTLPALPAGLVFARDGVLWHWPRAGGALEHLVGDSTPVHIGVKTWQFAVSQANRIAFLETHNRPTGGVRDVLVSQDLASGERLVLAEWDDYAEVYDLAISGDGRWVAYSKRECGGESESTSGDPCADTWYAQDASRTGTAFAFGTCVIESDREFSAVACEGLVDPASSRFAWGDARGLWLVDLPDGPVRRLTVADAARDEHDVAALQHPESWSPDGRWLVTDGPSGVGEGGTLRLWDMTAVEQAGEIGFRYVGRMDLGWNLGPHAGEAPLLETDADTPGLRLYGFDAARALTRQPLRYPGEGVNLLMMGWSPGDYPLLPFSPLGAPDGRMLFGLNHTANRYPGAGLFVGPAIPDPPYTEAPSVGPGRSHLPLNELHRIAAFPPMGRGERGEVTRDRLGSLLWSPDGSAFMYRAPGPATETDPYGLDAIILVGAADGRWLWDASAVLAGVRREEGQVAWVR